LSGATEPQGLAASTGMLADGLHTGAGGAGFGPQRSGKSVCCLGNFFFFVTRICGRRIHLSFDLALPFFFAFALEICFVHCLDFK
jgi:hypothetical protein